MKKQFLHFKKVSDYHKFANLAAPQHPLISLIDYSQVQYPDDIVDFKWRQDYYAIGMKRNIPYKFFYGQQEYDFDEGMMTFIKPNQVMSLENNPNINHKPTGWLLLIHPDFLWNSSLAKQINQYEFFGYSINEALFLSEKEELMIQEILQNIEREYMANIDKFSQKIIISQLELLFNYAERFYERQFITRKISNHQVLDQLETLLSDYFKDDLIEKGLPGMSAYAIMKGAIEVFTRYLAKELGERKISVNVVAPGAIATDFAGGSNKEADKVAIISSITALGRVGEAEDVGGVVAFLCSDKAGWVNGQRIEVSGGMLV